MSNIPPGFQKTEVGIIPSDWTTKKITDIAEICTGNTPPTSDQNNYGNDFLFVTPADLGKERIIKNTEKKLSKKGFNLSRKYPKNSILFTCIGSTIGKSGITDRELTSNQQINAIFPNSTFDSDYLYYILSLFSNRIKKTAGETAVPIINKTEFGETLVPLPPTKAEQTAIATALNDADKLITELEKLIAKKRNIKQGAMQELLRPKEGWEEKEFNGKLGDLFQISPSRKPIGIEEIVTFIGMEDVSGNGKVIKHNLLPFAEIKKGLTYFEKNDVLVAKITPCFENGKGACLDNLKTEKGFGSTEFHILRTNSNAVPRYVFYHTQSERFRRKLEAEMVGSAGQKRVAVAAILNYPLIVPSKAEQTRIAQILSDMDTKIEALEKKLEKYKMLKQGMMQELLTGKTRLI